MFKYKGDKDSLRQIIGEIFIFVEDKKVKEENRRFYVKSLLNYIFHAFSFKGEEFKELTKDLPPMVIEASESTYKYVREEGMEEGMAKGMEKGMEKGIVKGLEKGEIKAKSILLFKNLTKTILQFPQLTDVQVAAFQETEIEIVSSLRKFIFEETGKSFETKIHKLFFDKIELPKEEFSDLMKWYESVRNKG